MNLFSFWSPTFSNMNTTDSFSLGCGYMNYTIPKNEHIKLNDANTATWWVNSDLFKNETS